MLRFAIVLLFCLLQLQASVLRAGYSGKVYVISSEKVDGIDYFRIEDLRTIIPGEIFYPPGGRKAVFETEKGSILIRDRSIYAECGNEIINIVYPAVVGRDGARLPFTALEFMVFPFLEGANFRDSLFSLVFSDTLNQGPEEKAGYMKISRIIIDPGHGGKDPGAIGPSGTQEKEINLKTALLLKELFDTSDVEALLTRESDTYLSLRSRKDFANDKKADLFLSLHMNAIGGKKAKREAINGYSVFFLDIARNDKAKATELLENSALEFDGIDPLKKESGDIGFIMNDLMLNQYLYESEDLAVMIVENMTREFPENEFHKSLTGIMQAGFYVLDGPLMPSVLFEMGYISNSYDEALMKSEKNQKRIARIIFDSVMNFKNKYEGIGR